MVFKVFRVHLVPICFPNFLPYTIGLQDDLGKNARLEKLGTKTHFGLDAPILIYYSSESRTVNC